MMLIQIRDARTTALLVALLLKRSEKTRGRMSEKTLETLSRHERIRARFFDNVRRELDNLGVVIVELSRGGYGLLLASALEGAPICDPILVDVEQQADHPDEIECSANDADLGWREEE